MTLWLTTLGSRGLAVDVKPSALDETGPGGVSLWFELTDGPLAIALTADERDELIAMLQAAGAVRTRPASSGLPVRVLDP